MKKGKLWILTTIITVTVLALFLVGASKLQKKSLEELIGEKEKELTEQITRIISEAERVRYMYEQCALEVSKVDGNRADCIFWADWISIREPEDDPMILGMRQAADALSDEQEKSYAEEIIDGWLIEMHSWAKEERIPTYIVILLEESGDLALYYPYVMDGIETLIPLEEMARDNWTEDFDQRFQMGVDTINNAIDLMREQA